MAMLRSGKNTLHFIRFYRWEPMVGADDICLNCSQGSKSSKNSAGSTAERSKNMRWCLDGTCP